MTDGPELLSMTVSRPSHAWNPTSSTATRDIAVMVRLSRWSIQASTARPRISMPMTAATVRWIHSSHAL